MAARTGRPAPVASPPTLTLWQEEVYLAFNELSTERAFGMGPGPIPWRRIKEYAMDYGFDVEELSYIVRIMDAVFIAEQNKKLENSGNHNSAVP